MNYRRCRLAVFLPTLAVGLLGGCGRSNTVAAPAASSAAGATTLMFSPKNFPAAAPSIAATPALRKPDLSVPESDYIDLNHDTQGTALTYLVTSHDPTPLPDDAKLRRFSPAYASQSDSFKRQDIAVSELPKINAALEASKKENYYSLPIGPSASAPVVFPFLSVAPYDLSTHSFRLNVYGNSCWSGMVRTPQGAAISLAGSSLSCSVEVDDERSARAVESARAANLLELSGRMYLFVPTAIHGVGEAIVTRVDGKFRNRQTHEVLGNFNLHQPS